MLKKLIFIIGLIFINYSYLFPVDYTWNGGIGDWNVAGNWTPNGIPGTLAIDTATINGGIVNLNSSHNFTTLTLSGGTLNFNPACTLTISGNLTIIAGATLDIAVNNLPVPGGSYTNNGTLRRYGGTIAPFDINPGTVEYYGAGGAIQTQTGPDYYNLILSDTFTYTRVGNLTMANSLTIGTEATLEISGNLTVTVAANFSNNGKLTLTGTAAQALNFTNDTDSGTIEYSLTALRNLHFTNYYNLTTSTNFIYSTIGATTINNDLTITSGTLARGTNALTVTGNVSGAGNLTSGGGGAIDVNGSFNLTGNVTLSTTTTNIGGAFTAPAGASTFTNGGTLTFDTTIGTTITSNAKPLGTVVIAANKSLADNFTSNALTINNGQTLTTGAYNLTSSSITLNGTGNLNASGQLAGNTVTITDFFVDDGANTGQYNASPQTTTVGGNFEVNTFTHNSGTVNFNNTGQIQTGSTFYNMQVTNGTRTVSAATVTINNILTVNNAAATLAIGNNTLDVNNGTPSLTNGLITITNGTIDFRDVPVAGTTFAGTDLTISGTGTMNSTGRNITISDAGSAVSIGTGSITCASFSQSNGTVDAGSSNPGITCSSFSLTTGTFNAQSVTIQDSGDFSVSGGSFNVGGGVSTVRMTGVSNISSNQNLDNLISDSTVTMLTDITLNNNLTINNASSLATGAHSLTVTGNVVLNGNGLLNASVQGIGNSVSITGNITDDGANTGQYNASPQTTTVGGNFEVNTFTHNSGTVNFNNTGQIQTGSTFYNMQVTNGTRTVSAATVTINNILTVNNAAATLAIGNNTLDVNNGTPSLTNGLITITNGTIDFRDVPVAGTTFAGTSVNLTGAGSINSTGRNITINNALSTISLGTGSLSCVAFSQSDGTVNAGTGNFTVGVMSVTGGTFTQTGNEGINTHSLTSLAVSGGACSWDLGDLTFSGTFSHTNGTVNFGTKTVTGVTTFTVTNPNGDCDLGGATITATGNVIISTTGIGSLIPDTSLLIMNGGNLSSGSALNNLRITAACTLLSDITLNGNLTVSDGAATITTFNLGGQNLTVGSAGGGGTITVGENDILVATASEIITVYGNIDFSAVDNNFTQATSTVLLDGGNTTLNAPDETFYNLTIAKGAAVNTVGLSSDLNIAGNLNITTGTLNQTTNSSSISGQVTIDNGATWNCITNNNITVSIGGSVINNGTIDFDGGGAGVGGADTISIRSTIPGTQRDWGGSGTFEMDDVDVRDQTCITGTPAFIPQILNSEGTDSGNNINWNITFIAPTITISGTVYSDEGITPITSNRTVRLVVYYTSTIKSSFTTTALAGTGVYNFTQIAVNNGTRMLVYIDNDALFFGSTANISDGPTVSALDIYQNHLIIKDEAGVNITNTDLTNLLYPSSASPDADIRYTISGSDLTVDPSFEIYIANASTFRPGGDISCGYLEVVGTLITDDNALTASSNVVISGSLNASGQTSPPNDIDIDGNVSCSGTFIQGNQPITLSGTTIDFTGAIFTDDGGATDETFILDRGGAVTFTPSGSNFGAFQVSTPGTNVSLSADLQVDALTIDNGTIFNTGNNTLTVNGVTGVSGTLNTGNDDCTFTGAVDSSGTFNVGGSGDVRFSSTYGATASTGTVSMQGTGNLLIVGNATFTGGNLTGNAVAGQNPTIEFRGNVIFNTFVHNNDVLLFSGASSPQLFNSNGQNCSTVNITKDAAANIVRLNTSNLTISNANLNINTGILDLNGLDLIVNDTTGTAGNLSIGVNGTLDASAAGSDITIQGNWVNTGIFNSGANTVYFNGTGTQQVNAGGVDNNNTDFYNVAVNNGGTLQLLTTSMEIDGSLALTNLSSVNMNGLDMDLGSGLAGGTGLSIASGCGWTGGNSLEFEGTFSVSDANATKVNLGNVEVDGNITQTTVIQVTNLLIDVTRILDSNGQNLYVSGDWNNNGTFIEGNNTVIFNGGGTSDVNSGASAVTDADHDFNIIRIENNTTVNVITSPIRITNSLQLIGDNDIFDVNSLNFIINAIDFTGNNGTFELHGTQTTYTISNLDTTNGTVLYSDGGVIGYVRYSLFYYLIFAGGTHQLTGNMEVLRDITFISGQVNALNYIISVHGNFDSSGGGTFNAGTSTVLFVDNSIDSTVSGNNTFYNFACNTGDKIIYFTFGNTTTIAAGGTFSIQGVNDANRVELLSTYTATNPHTAPYDEIYYPAMQWRIDILPGAFADVNWVYVELSYSVRPIFPDDTIFRPTRYAGQYDWCHNWLNIMPVMNSGVEDSNNNGLINRIRVQVVIGTTLDDNPATNPTAFDGLQVLIQSPWSVTGYETDIPNDDTFYILIAKPGFALDTYSTPDWSISENTTLKTSTGERYVFTTPVGVDYSQDPADEADPIIGYTLARAGTSQVFVHLSEPVIESGGGAIDESNFEFGALNYPQNITLIGTREYLLNFNPATTIFTIANIVSGDPVTYSNIIDPSTNNNQLHGAASVDHRVSDLALGITGNEPIIPFILYDNTPREPGPEGVGYVTVFDGTGWIQDYPDQPSNTALLQANFGGASYPVNILWDTNVAAANKINGLWLPVGSNTFGLVPAENAGTSAILGSNDAGPPSHSDFQFDLTNTELINEVVVEFFISLTNAPNPTIYAARLERPNASNWYRSVKPWAFGIHKPGGQKGNVTIFNNVINPNAGERVKLHYVLKKSGSVTIQVFTLAGDIVKVLYRGRLSAGQHSTVWDGRNEGGRVVAKGMYFIRIVGPGVDETRKVLVVK